MKTQQTKAQRAWMCEDYRDFAHRLSDKRMKLRNGVAIPFVPVFVYKRK